MKRSENVNEKHPRKEKLPGFRSRQSERSPEGDRRRARNGIVIGSRQFARARAISRSFVALVKGQTGNSLLCRVGLFEFRSGGKIGKIEIEIEGADTRDWQVSPRVERRKKNTREGHDPEECHQRDSPSPLRSPARGAIDARLAFSRWPSSRGNRDAVLRSYVTAENPRVVRRTRTWCILMQIPLRSTT